MKRSLALYVLAAGILLIPAVLIGGNLRSLAEGLLYVQQRRTWDPDAVRPIASDGPYGVCHELVLLDNAGRYQRIADKLRAANLSPTLIPVPDEPLPNMLVLFGEEGPYTLYVAHYDKSRETASYQGASDNTAAVCVLLAVAKELASSEAAASEPCRPTALLFTSAEEVGLKGATSFLAWAQAGNLEVAEVLNLDMLGRGRVALRPAGSPGFYFWVPGLGDMVFDGRRVYEGQPYPPLDMGLVSQLETVADSELVVYHRFVVLSDANVFRNAGIPTVTLSSDNMYYLDLVWERDTDRIELLSEDNLARAHHLLREYALQCP